MKCNEIPELNGAKRNEKGIEWNETCEGSKRNDWAIAKEWSYETEQWLINNNRKIEYNKPFIV